MIKKFYPQKNPSAFWNKIPDVDVQITAYAVHKLPLVRAMLTGARADMACFHINVSSKRKIYKCSLWRGTVAEGFEIHTEKNEINPSVLSEICGGFSPLAKNLSQRWPEAARPKTIGLATDGHRIVFSSEYPSCESYQWMERHLNSRSPSSIIFDDGNPGTISKICP